MNSDEYQYLNLVNDILENGIMEEHKCIGETCRKSVK
jgi:hypothetical protein